MSDRLFACLYQPPLPGQPVRGVGFVVRGVGSSDPTDPVMSHGQAGSKEPAQRTHADPAARTQVPLVAIAAEFAPRYERHRADLVSIDVCGLSRLFGSPM